MVKNRLEVYDWFRGLASIAVVCGHFKPFDIPKAYFVWAVHIFVIVTTGLLSRSPLNFEKLARRLSYLAFVYAALLLVFCPIFLFESSPQPPLGHFFLDVRKVFIANPYFGHLWYLLLYVQMLFLLFLFKNQLPKWKTGTVLAGSFIISTVCYAFFRFYARSFDTVFLPSWFFVMAVGWYAVPPLARKIEKTDVFRVWRVAAALAALAAVYSQPALRGLLAAPEERVSPLNTFVYFLVLYFLAEVFFWLRPVKAFEPARSFVAQLSRYTLIIYIYHQGINKLLELRYGTGINRSLETVACLLSGLALAFVIHQSYVFLEGKVMGVFSKNKAVPSRSHPAEAVAVTTSAIVRSQERL